MLVRSMAIIHVFFCKTDWLIYIWLCWVLVAAWDLASPAVVHRLLTVRASPVAKHRLWAHGPNCSAAVGPSHTA